MSAIACFSSLPQVIAAYPYWIPGVPPEAANAGRRGRAAPAAMPASAETNSRREVGDSILNFPRFHPTVFCGVRSSVRVSEPICEGTGGKLGTLGVKEMPKAPTKPHDSEQG